MATLILGKAMFHICYLKKGLAYVSTLKYYENTAPKECEQILYVAFDVLAINVVLKLCYSELCRKKQPIID